MSTGLLLLLAVLLGAPTAEAGRRRAQEPAPAQVESRPTLQLQVRRADGAPAARAVVTIDGLERGKTDGAGAFTYEGLADGQTVVVGVASTDGTLESALLTVVLVGGEQVLPLELVPEAPPEPEAESPVPAAGRASAVAPAAPVSHLSELVVWVLDERGRPLPEATVSVNGRAVGITRADGSVSLTEQRPGRRVTVAVEAAHRTPVSVERFALEPGEQARTVVLWPRDDDEDGIVDLVDRCPEAPETPNGYADDDGCPDGLASLSVLVLDPDRHPAEDAEVKVGGTVAGHTGSDGRLLVSGLFPGTRVPVMAAVDDPLLAPAGFGAIDIGDGKQTVTVVLQRSSAALHTAPQLTVEAMDTSGRPVPYANVIVDGQYKGRTDRDGLFVYTGRSAGADLIVGVTAPFRDREVSALEVVHLDGGPQTARIWLDGSDGGVGAESLDDPDGDGRTDTWDECPDEPETVNDYRDDDGCPDALAQVVVVVSEDGGAPVAGAVVTVNGREAGRTDAAGRLQLDETQPGVALEAVVERPGSDLRPARVTWSDLGEGRQERSVVLAVVDTDGDGLRDAADACPAEREVENGYADDDGCPDKLATLFLTVLDPDGSRVSGADVLVAGRPVGLTDADGWAEIPDLAPGSGIAVEVRAAAGSAEVRVDLVEGAQRERVVIGREAHAERAD